MPTINLPSKKKENKNKERNQTEARKLRQNTYNLPAWRKLRNTYIREHAICTDCIGKGKITPAVDIHHIKTPFQNGTVNYTLLLDPTNLVALCKDCHAARHNEQQGYKTPQRIIEELDALFENIEEENVN